MNQRNSGQKAHLHITTSPHVKNPLTVEKIMRNVVYAIVPLCVYSIWLFGLSVLLLIIVTTLSCVITEQFFSSLSGKGVTINDKSAIITGLLLALTLPPGFPLWMAVVAAVSGIGLAKVIFGGLGNNVFNPALVGRAFVQASFPIAITTWTPALTVHRFTECIPTTLTLPFTVPPSITEWVQSVSIDGFTGATPLTLQKFEHITTEPLNLFLGMSAGSAGETCSLLIILCGMYLIARKMMNWVIPASVIMGALLTSSIFYAVDPTVYPEPMFVLFSGGLMLGAFFMASDMVGSPVTPVGVIIYGLMIGVTTVIIRIFGGLPEGVMYAILLGNAASPLIDHCTQPRVYGHKRGGVHVK